MTTMEATAARDIILDIGAERTLFGVNVVVGAIKEGVSVRRKGTERLARHGNYSEAGKRGARLVTVSGIFWADTPVEAAQAEDHLRAVLADGEAGRLIKKTVLGDRWANCYLFGTPDVALDTETDGEFSIDFECPNPRWYGDLATLFTGAQAAGGSLYLPMFAPIDGTASGEGEGIAHFGDGGNPGTVTWTNTGSADVSPLFRVTNAAGFTITEVETQRRIVYTGLVPAGQFLDVDANDGTVNINGTADRSSELTLAQWPVIPGHTTRTYMLESVTAGASMTMEVHPAWW